MARISLSLLKIEFYFQTGPYSPSQICIYECKKQEVENITLVPKCDPFDALLDFCYFTPHSLYG
jgi:hypothetical protein